MPEPIDSASGYVLRTALGDLSWQEHALCRGATKELSQMFFCLEEDSFEHDGQVATGLQVQRYLVDTICSHCPVQWDCLRHAVVVDESSGVWAVTGRDRRWLMKRRNPLGIIDAARLRKQPLHETITELRAAMTKHPAMRPRAKPPV